MMGTHRAQCASPVSANRIGAIGKILVCVLIMAFGCGGVPNDPPRDIFFYLIDTLRADGLTTYGAPDTSPFIERLAREGVVFERCYAQAPWTKPSVGAILTSRYPATTGIYRLRDRIPQYIPTLPEVLSRAGYETAGFSTNPIMGRLGGFNRGFQHFIGTGRILSKGNPISNASGSADAINDWIFPWLSKRKRDAAGHRSPLFLYMHSIDPHEEYEPSLPYLRLFADPAAYDAHRAIRQHLLDHRTSDEVVDLHRTSLHFHQGGIDAGPFMAYSRSLYNGDVRANDTAIQRLFERLQSNGALERALVVVTSDHGEEFMEHGGTSHGFSLYEELIRVPLIIWAPGLLPAGKRITEPVQSIDIYPTLLSLAGLEAPEGLQGRDLSPLIWGESNAAAPRPIFSEKRQSVPDTGIALHKGSAAAIIRFPWKFIRNYLSPRDRTLPERELFRLDTDPHEQENLIHQHPDLAREFEKEIESWMKSNQELRALEKHAANPSNRRHKQ